MRLNNKINYAALSNAEFDAKIKELWTDFEEEFGIKFFLEDGTPRPVTEVLDDFYLRSTPQRAGEIVSLLVANGDILFANILKHKQ